MNVLKQTTAILATGWFLVNLPSAVGAPAYPLRRSVTGRYLVDQSNAPRMIIGDAPQALIVNISTNYAAIGSESQVFILPSAANRFFRLAGP